MINVMLFRQEINLAKLLDFRGALAFLVERASFSTGIAWCGRCSCRRPRTRWSRPRVPSTDTGA